ncbi:hypothetical protein BH09ACT12_BH09ACT12_10280 [soil metagenome]
MPDVVFRHGRLFDGHRYRGAVDAVLVRDGRVAGPVWLWVEWSARRN